MVIISVSVDHQINEQQMHFFAYKIVVLKIMRKISLKTVFLLKIEISSSLYVKINRFSNVRNISVCLILKCNSLLTAHQSHFQRDSKEKKLDFHFFVLNALSYPPRFSKIKNYFTHPFCLCIPLCTCCAVLLRRWSVNSSSRVLIAESLQILTVQ